MGIVLAVIAAVFAALTVVLTKAGLKDVDASVTFAVQAVIIFLITWGIALAGGNIQQTLRGLDRRTWLFLIGAGICTTLSTVFSYRALQVADATLVSPIERLSLVLATILAVFFLKEKLPWTAVFGIGLMVVGAVLVGIGKK